MYPAKLANEMHLFIFFMEADTKDSQDDQDMETIPGSISNTTVTSQY
jgi:hypothetical protein